MNNLLDVYTKIKLRIGSEIIVSYYRYGHKINRTIILTDICEFLYVYGMTDYGEFITLEFFNNHSIIESIKVANSNVPIYYNPYVGKDIFDGFTISDECLLEIRKKVLGEDYINFENNNVNNIYIERDNLIEKYIAKDKVITYDELFFSNRQREKFEMFFKMLVDELSIYAKKKGMDSELKFICAGTTSLIYEIGDKIVKVGKPRRCGYIPYCEYILQPIINRDFSFDGYPIHVEVTQKVLTLQENVRNLYSNNKEFNQAISKIRDFLSSIGLAMRDLYPGNIGILMEDNIIHYDEIDFPTSDMIVSSIQSNNSLKVLKKGKFVIIDLDCLKIIDIDKYTAYLKNIGYNEEKITELYYHNKCLVRR